MSVLALVPPAAAAAGGALAHRLRHGPRRPGWSLATEIAVAVQRAALDRMATMEPAAARRTLARVLRAPARSEGVAERAGMLGGVPVLHHEPQDARPDAPTVLYLHGGGYVLGSPATHAPLTAGLARASGGRVASVDYRLAPEHPYPAALRDAIAAHDALRASGVAAERLLVAGDSAGGNLAASLLLALRDRGAEAPAGGVLVCPWVDLGNSGDSFARNAETDTLTRAAARTWSEQFRAGRDPADPAVSPLHADLAGLPPLLVLGGGAEVLIDQIEAFAARARAAGVRIDLEVAPEMFHDWMLLPGLPEGAAAVERIGAWIRAVAAPETG